MAQLLGLGIALLVIGVILSILPIFGALSGPLVYIGWVLIVVGLVLAVFQFATGRGRGAGGGRSM